MERLFFPKKTKFWAMEMEDKEALGKEREKDRDEEIEDRVRER